MIKDLMNLAGFMIPHKNDVTVAPGAPPEPGFVFLFIYFQFSLNDHFGRTFVSMQVYMKVALDTLALVSCFCPQKIPCAKGHLYQQ